MHSRSVRTIPLRYIAGASLVLAIVVVGAHIPGRWRGGRTAENADIPLRPLPPEEAATLIAGRGDARSLARIERFKADGVVISTGVYLLPDDAFRGSARVASHLKQRGTSSAPAVGRTTTTFTS